MPAALSTPPTWEPSPYRFTARREPRPIEPYLDNLSQPISGVASRSPEKGNGAWPSRTSGGPCAVRTARRHQRHKHPHSAHARPLRPAGPAGAPGATAPCQWLGDAGAGTAPGPGGCGGPPPQLLSLGLLGLYDPWGSTQAAWGAGTATVKYTYTGQEFDPGTGLLYDRARYYDPVLGRFTQPAPLPPQGRTGADLTISGFLV